MIFYRFWAFYAQFCSQALAKAAGIQKKTTEGAPSARPTGARSAPVAVVFSIPTALARAWEQNSE